MVAGVGTGVDTGVSGSRCGGRSLSWVDNGTGELLLPAGARAYLATDSTVETRASRQP